MATGRRPTRRKANGDRATPGAGSGEEEAFDPGHRSLHIESAELELIKQLWPLMPSPRAVKRLSNVYRFVRAQVPPHELPSFTGESGPPGKYPAVLILLAVLIRPARRRPEGAEHRPRLSARDVERRTGRHVGRAAARARQAPPGDEGLRGLSARNRPQPAAPVMRFSFSFLGDRILRRTNPRCLLPRASATPQNSPEPRAARMPRAYGFGTLDGPAFAA